MFGHIQRRSTACMRTCLLTSAFGLVVFIIVLGIMLSNNCLTKNQMFMAQPIVISEYERGYVETDLRIHKYLHILNSSDESEEDGALNNNKCVQLKTTLGPTPICVYDPEIDAAVSATIIKTGVWEKDYLSLMALILTVNPGMQLLDLGSNMGVFTIQAAIMGHKVVAVDANKSNLRLLSKSLNLGGLREYVTLVWNAVTNVHETINLTITKNNIGGSYVKSAGELHFKSTGVKQVRAITLEDLNVFFKDIPLFIKIDIQGSEWEAFRGGEIFLREVNIRYMLMEWILYKTAKTGREFATYVSSFGFQPHEPNTAMKKLSIDTVESWPYDVLWIRE